MKNKKKLSNEYKFRIFFYIYVVISFFLSLVLALRIIEYTNLHPNSFIRTSVFMLGSFRSVAPNPTESEMIMKGSFFLPLLIFGLLGWVMFYFINKKYNIWVKTGDSGYN